MILLLQSQGETAEPPEGGVVTRLVEEARRARVRLIAKAVLWTDGLRLCARRVKQNGRVHGVTATQVSQATKKPDRRPALARRLERTAPDGQTHRPARDAARV